jgi:gliding motility-associated-like protein
VLKDGDVTLVEGVDYQVVYEDNVDAGTATVKITGIGNYSGSLTDSFEIVSKSLEGATISDVADLTYTGEALTPVVTVADGEVTLEEGKDYTVSYIDNVNAGTATVTITGIGNYAGTLSSNFVIVKKSVTITAADKERNFGAENPAFTLLYEGLVAGATRVAEEPEISTEATAVSAPGTYEIVLTGGSDPNYVITLVNGTLTVLNTSISEVTNLESTVEDKQIKLTWALPAEFFGELSGYRIEISEDGENFTALAETEALEFLATGLTNTQKYWFRISAFSEFTVGDSKVIGPLIPLAVETGDNDSVDLQEPGEYSFTLDGEEEDIFLDIVNDALEFESGPLKMQLAGNRSTGDRLPILDGLLLLEPSGVAAVNGEGFKPNTVVSVWLVQNVETGSGGRMLPREVYMQTHIREVNNGWQQNSRVMGAEAGDIYFLGFADVDANGEFAADFDIPQEIKPGRYTLQATGITMSGQSMTLNLGAILIEDVLLDTDGDLVPDVYEFIQGTDPNDPTDFRDSSGDGVPDYVRERSPIEYFVSGAVQSAWGSPVSPTDLPKEVVAMNGQGQLVIFKVTWDLGTVNVFNRGSYTVKGELEIPKGMFNAYNLIPTLEVVILAKPAPKDILLSNNIFEGSKTSADVVIGSLTVVDPVDNVHLTGLPYGLEDNRYFKVINGVLYWNGEDPAAGRTSFKIVVRVTDRDGNMLDRTFEISRLRKKVEEIEIYNTFTPEGDGMNDTWGVPELRYYQGARIQVFERSGNRLFYTEDPDVRWDGTFNGKEMPVGSYYWVLEVRETGTVRKGILNLLRK